MGDVFGLCAGQQIGVSLVKIANNTHRHTHTPLFIYAHFIWQVCAENWETHKQQSINRDMLIMSPNRIGQNTVSF